MENVNVLREFAEPVLSEAECAHLVAALGPRAVKRATVQYEAISDARTNAIARIDDSHDGAGAEVERVVAWLAAQLGVARTHFERPMLLRYLPGERYAPHYDWLRDEPNQRTHTALVYLNSVSAFAGGATHFPSLGVRVQPRVGRAILFAVADPAPPHARVDLALHEAEPLVAGTKWVLQIFVRAQPLTAHRPLPFGVALTNSTQAQPAGIRGARRNARGRPSGVEARV